MESNDGTPVTKPAPEITISSVDVERLDPLLDLPANRDQPTVRALRAEIDRAKIVDPADLPADVVTMNSTAVVVDETSGARHELTLVYPRDTDGTPGKVSILAPVGSAMLGMRAGQSIDWPMPDGRRARLRILDVRH